MAALIADIALELLSNYVTKKGQSCSTVMIKNASRNLNVHPTGILPCDDTLGPWVIRPFKF